jgi:hypothetical protein
MTITQLTEAERILFAESEQIIRDQIERLLHAGIALKRIKTRKTYKPQIPHV